MLGFQPMTYGSESECAIHYTTAPHKYWYGMLDFIRQCRYLVTDTVVDRKP